MWLDELRGVDEKAPRRAGTEDAPSKPGATHTQVTLTNFLRRLGG